MKQQGRVLYIRTYHKHNSSLVTIKSINFKVKLILGFMPYSLNKRTLCHLAILILTSYTVSSQSLLSHFAKTMGILCDLASFAIHYHLK